jgi:guanylate kinase
MLKKKFGSLARAVYIHSNVDPDRMYRLAEERHRGATIHQKALLEDTMRRAEKIRTVHRKYVENTALFNHTILNLGGKKHLYRQLRNVLSDPSPLRVASDSPVRIFVITGASHSGKDELVNAMKDMDRNVEVYRKVTTRPKRDGDRSELRHVERVNFAAFDVRYTMQGHVYGVSSLEIWNLLAGGRVALLVLSDRESIEKLVAGFGDVCTVVYVHANYEERDLRSRMSLEGVAADEFDKRMNMIQELFDLYVERTNLFDHVLLNTAEPEDLFDQAFNLLDHYVRLV